MYQISNINRSVLITLNFFLGLTALAGGICLIAGINTPPPEYLGTSFFKDYTFPGLALSGIVGGSAVTAGLLLIRKHRHNLLFSVSAGIIVIIFEFVEVLIIGSPAGPARTLQVIYFTLGMLIIIISLLPVFFGDVSQNTGK